METTVVKIGIIIILIFIIIGILAAQGHMRITVSSDNAYTISNSPHNSVIANNASDNISAPVKIHNVILTTTDIKRPYKILGPVRTKPNYDDDLCAIWPPDITTPVFYPKDIYSQCDAVIGIRFVPVIIGVNGNIPTSSSFMIYGTAVKFIGNK